MTENEAIRELKQNIEMPFGSDISNEASKLAIKALEEIQQYRAIGTVEECQKSREEQRAKKPILNKNANIIFCPICERKVRRNYDMHCSGCGQALDWSE